MVAPGALGGNVTTGATFCLDVAQGNREALGKQGPGECSRPGVCGLPPSSPLSAPPKIWVRCGFYSSSCDMTGRKEFPGKGVKPES